MATKSKQDNRSGTSAGDLLSELPLDRLKDEVVELGKAMAQRGLAKVGERMSGATGKLGDLAPGPGDVVKAVAKAGSPMGPVKSAAGKVKDALPGVGSDDSGDESGSSSNSVGDDTDLKVTNIVESVDVPVSREIAYQLWTQFEEFPSFMKKVEAVNQKDPEVVTWKAQIFWSHRSWTGKIVDQVPPERIVWKSEAEKGKVDGAVTFHEIAPDLTRVLVSLEYHPQGLFERTGNLWRAQGRRVRLELKHFRRHVANHALINQDDVDGWEGEIHDGKVKPRRRSSSSARKTTAKKSANGGSTAKKTAAKKSANGGSTARKTAAKKSTSGGSTARKSTARKSTAKKSAASGSSTAKKTARKSTARKSTAKKTASGNATTKRTAAASKRSSTTSARASTPRKSAARKTTGSKSRSSRTKS